MSDSARVKAVEAYVQSMRTGEGAASRRAAPFIAPDAVAVLGSGELEGHDAVLAHITGIWPSTGTYGQGGWSEPYADGDDLKVDAVFPMVGAAPRAAHLTFSFDGDLISRVVEELETAPPPVPSKTITLPVRGAISGALANGTPMVLAYTGEDGAPALSLRGSVSVYSDTQLSLWLRNAKGGLVGAVAADRPNLSLLYRDSKNRTTLIVKGRAHLETDQTVRDRVFELTPEVEQLHDVARNGAALIIDVTEIRGTSPAGPLVIQP